MENETKQTPKIIPAKICPIEDGTCEGTNGGKCPNEASGHIIRAKYVKPEEIATKE